MLGRQNPVIRRLRTLRRDGDARREAGVLLAEGIHLTREALSSNASFETVVVSPGIHTHAEGPALLQELARRDVCPLETTDSVLASLQDVRSPQPILSVVRTPTFGVDWLVERNPPFVLVVAGIQDPGNLGSLIRTSEAAGVGGLIQLRGGVDPFHPRAVRGSMGSIFRLPTAVMETDPCLATLQRQGRTRVGAAAGAGTTLREFQWEDPAALFLGSEGSGLPATLLGAMDQRVTIPLASTVESLSVGAAAAVLLFDRAARRST
ncbi:MAG: RNA methyltransferase [Acidobacteriota bacterium]|nr:RNA methyltransferase [Acidobacteriota bacterium]